jgi:peptide deformylase
LSAIQIGVPLRIFITILGGRQQIYINPTIIRTDEPYIPGQEGCLSVPKTTRVVQRYKGILLQPLALKPFPKRSVYLTDYAARVVQHEMDHLDGRLFIDKEEIR